MDRMSDETGVGLVLRLQDTRGRPRGYTSRRLGRVVEPKVRRTEGFPPSVGSRTEGSDDTRIHSQYPI